MQEARLEEAYRCFDRAIKLEPESGEAWKRRGVALGIMGCYEEVAGSLKEAIRIEPKDQEAWMLIGFCLVRLFQYSDAWATSRGRCNYRRMSTPGTGGICFWRRWAMKRSS
jgi:tetratricopeptide (TPR) repeat protein